MLLLLGCAPPTPTLTLPPVPVATAEPLAVDRLLAPTPFGATTDVLCPWARGEAVPDASIARWLAEKRLTWRVLNVAAGTFGGEPLGKAAELRDAQGALEKRCGGTLREDYVVAAGVGATHGEVTRAVMAVARARYADPWVAVSGAPVTAPERRASGAALVLVLGRTPTVLVDDVPTDAGLETALPGARCLIVSASEKAGWGDTVSAFAQGRSAGVAVYLAQMVGGEAPAPAPHADGPAGAPLHGTLAALRVTTPGLGGSPCGGPAILQVEAIPALPPK